MTRRPKTITPTFRVTPDFWDRVHIAAEQSGVSTSRFLRIVLSEYMTEHGLGKKQGRPRGEGYVPINNLKGHDVD